MAEQFIFIMLSIILFVIIFFKMIKKNDTSYVPILAVEALGIGIDFVFLVTNHNLNFFIKAIIYTMSGSNLFENEEYKWIMTYDNEIFVLIHKLEYPYKF